MRRGGGRQELVFERIVNEEQVRGSCIYTPMKPRGRRRKISKEVPITSINDVKILFASALEGRPWV